MKSLILGLLLVTGGLVAQEQPAQEQSAQTAEQPHLSATQREALRTQSPPVKTHSKKHANKPSKYQVTKNKSTITATRQYEGK